MTYEEARGAKEAFVQEHMLHGPCALYIDVCGLTTRGVIESQGLAVPSGKDLSEWMLAVGLRMPLPEGLILPETYRGLELFVSVVGGIKAQEGKK